jgi:hypothetical protein
MSCVPSDPIHLAETYRLLRARHSEAVARDSPMRARIGADLDDAERELVGALGPDGHIDWRGRRYDVRDGRISVLIGWSGA